MNWLQVVGWAGSALVVWSLLQTRILRLRLLNLAGSVVLTGFNIVIAVWPMVGLNLALAAINVVQLRRLLGDRHRDTAYTVIEVRPDDTFLRHVLDTHAADISRFTPGFAGPGPHDLAAVVLQGDRTIGVVVASDVGAGTAQVDLDYVVPEFRDFTPGEFVYRRSELFTRHGFHRVLAPAGMRDSQAYLERLGFRGDPPALALGAGDHGLPDGQAPLAHD